MTVITACCAVNRAAALVTPRPAPLLWGFAGYVIFYVMAGLLIGRMFAALARRL